MEPKLSYSSVTQAVSFPTKEQAVIIDAIDDTPIKDYAYAFGKIIDSTQIRFLSRMSNNRICMFVSTKEIADELIDKHQCIVVNNKKIPIRPLISRNKRIIFSNVCPIIPHIVIENKLAELEIKLVSPVSFIKAGISEPGFNHILSFRRQAYIPPEDLKKIPDRMQIDFDGSTYWIYASSDIMTCFICKKEGHIANKCPDNSSTANKTITSDICDTINTVPDFQPFPSFKRPHPPTTESSQSIVIPTDTSDSEEFSISEAESGEISADCSVNTLSVKKDKRGIKKQKRLPTLDLQPTELEEIKNTIEKSDYPMSISEFINFLEESYGKENIIQISHSYTEDIDNLIRMFKDIIPKISSRKVKSRLTRIIKKLSSSS